MNNRNTNIRKIANASLAAVLISAFHAATAMESDDGPLMDSHQMHAEVERVLEKFQRNMEAYYQRTRTKNATTPLMISETAKPENLKKQDHLLNDKYYVRASGTEIYGTLEFSQNNPDQIEISHFNCPYDPYQGTILYFKSKDEGVDNNCIPALKKLGDGQYRLFVHQEDDSIRGNIDPLESGFDLDMLDKFWEKKGNSKEIFIRYDHKIMQDILLKERHATPFIDDNYFIENLVKKYSTDKYKYSIEYGEHQISRFVTSTLPNTTFSLKKFPGNPLQYGQRVQWDSGNDFNNMDIRCMIETDGNHVLLVEYPYGLGYGVSASATQKFGVRNWPFNHLRNSV